MKKKPKPKRFVSVDMGYGPAEYWVEALVIDERQDKGLFDEELQTSLLVEIPGGERLWAAYWTETPNTKT